MEESWVEGRKPNFTTSSPINPFICASVPSHLAPHQHSKGLSSRSEEPCLASPQEGNSNHHLLLFAQRKEEEGSYVEALSNLWTERKNPSQACSHTHSHHSLAVLLGATIYLTLPHRGSTCRPALPTTFPCQAQDKLTFSTLGHRISSSDPCRPTYREAVAPRGLAVIFYAVSKAIPNHFNYIYAVSNTQVEETNWGRMEMAARLSHCQFLSQADKAISHSQLSARTENASSFLF